MTEMATDIVIRECTTVEELAECVMLQREVFALPEIEISPVRHFIVTKNAGGFSLGAFKGNKLIGFVLSVPAYLRGERAFYSHMTAVRPEFQSHGIGARLKWAQRARSLEEGVKYIKWTFEPVKSRNAYFNLEKLGAVAREYKENFYGTDYATSVEQNTKIGLASDRLFAEWELESPKVEALSACRPFVEGREPAATISIMADWPGLVAQDTERALNAQRRIRTEFLDAFRRGLVARGFARESVAGEPTYLLYEN